MLVTPRIQSRDSWGPLVRATGATVVGGTGDLLT